MISIDTNVVIRRLVADDPEQTKKAKSLFEGSMPVLITDIVLIETVWVLAGKRYQAQKVDIIRAVTQLMEEPNVVFENKEAVWTALCDYAGARSIKDGVGLADTLILNKAKATAEIWGVTFKGHYSFDVQAQSLPGVKKP